MFGNSRKLGRRNLVRKGQFWLQMEALVITTLHGSIVEERSRQKH